MLSTSLQELRFEYYQQYHINKLSVFCIGFGGGIQQGTHIGGVCVGGGSCWVVVRVCECLKLI